MSKPNSHSTNFNFEFPTLSSDPTLQNGVVFCGRVMVRQSEKPLLLMARCKSLSKPNPVRSTHRRYGSVQIPATGYSRVKRSGSTRRCTSNGLFGTVKFPVQMELNDIRKRQTARIARITATITTAPNGVSEKGEKGGWKRQLIRTLRRKGCEWLNALSTSSFDF